jgi:two-component system nitrogen regulation response regulator NtrX
MKGSFTGAVQDRPASSSRPTRGTLFLDEVGDMSQAAQAKVLRVLQTASCTRIGGSKQIKVDVRVSPRRTRSSRAEIAAGPLPRGPVLPLTSVPLRVPRLRDGARTFRCSFRHFLAIAPKQDGLPSQGHRRRRDAAAAGARLAGQRARAAEHGRAAADPRHGAAHHRARRRPPRRARAGGDGGGLGAVADAGTFEEFKHAAERAFLLAKLRQHDWNVSETARALEMPRSNVYKKIERYGLKREEA